MDSAVRASARLLAGVFVLALIPRLTLAIVYRDAPLGLDDMLQYDMLARSLLAGNGYRWYDRADVEQLQPYLRSMGVTILPSQVPPQGLLTTFRAPGYPLFLAAVYGVVGLAKRVETVRILQAVFTALLAPLTTLLALRIDLTKRAAALAGAAVGLYPILWMYPLGLASEDLFIPLVLLSVLALLWAAESRAWVGTCAAGLALGAATLTRGAFGLFLPVAAIWLWRNAHLRLAGLLTIVATAMILPWSIRNSILLGRPSFVENSAAYNLFVGYHPQGDGGFVTTVATQPLRFLDDGQRDRWAMAQATGFILADPARDLDLSLRRLAYFWGPEDREMLYFYSNDFFGAIPQPWLAAAYLVLVLPLALIGLAAPLGMAASPPHPARSLILGLVVASLLAYVPILSEPRFHLPLVPFLAVYAGAAWTATGQGSRMVDGLRRGHLGWWLALASVVALLALWGWDWARELPRLLSVMRPGGHVLYLDY